MNRAYSLITLKSADADQRVIEGVASTPSTDRQGDVVNPLGATFRLPLPLLWQHRHDEPIGHVEWAQPTAKGIPFRARFVKIDEAGPLKDRLDTAWQSVKSGLVRAVSIGFIPTDAEPIATGYRFNKWEWTELSAVTIPAQAEATIANAKFFDQQSVDSRMTVRNIRPKPVRPLADAIQKAVDDYADDRGWEANPLWKREPLAGQLFAGFMAMATTTQSHLEALHDRLARVEADHAG